MSAEIGPSERALMGMSREAAQALRERVFALERHALVGNMGALAAGAIHLAEDFRRPKKPRPIDVKDDRLTKIQTDEGRWHWIDAQGGVHSAPAAPLSCQDADEPEGWIS